MTNVLAADIGGTNLRLAIVDAESQAHNRIEKDISGLAYQEIYSILEKEITDIFPLAIRMQVGAVGLSLTGHVDRLAGTVSYLPEGNKIIFQVRDRIQELTDDLPTSVINDGTAIALAEADSGAAKGHDNSVSIHLGTYTASGVIVGGQPVEKRTGSPLLGAILSEEDGSIQPVNLAFSGAGFESILRRRIEQNPDSELSRAYTPGTKAGEYIYKMARQGNSDAIEIYRYAGHKLGIHIASVMNVFDPEVVTLGGRMMEAQDLFLPEARSVIDQYAVHSIDNDSGSASQKLVQAVYSRDAGLIGAAIAARQLLK